MLVLYFVLIKDICFNVVCVVVMIFGRLFVVEFYLGYMNVFVVVWFLGFEGCGVVEVLFGNYEFFGRLLRMWFWCVD